MTSRASIITFRPCSEDQLPLLLRMQEEAFASLPSPHMLRCNTPAMLAACLRTPHTTWGAWTEDAGLVAFSVLFVPQDAQEDLSLWLDGMATAGLRSANNKLCIVRPPFRGRGLQLALGWRVEQEAVQRGTQLLCATAAPGNVASARNLLRQGYVLNRRLRKYEGGLLRNLYVKRLQ